MDNIRQLIRQAMTTAGLSQRLLAERVGVSPAYLSRRLTGYTPMTIADAVAFALELDVELEELVDAFRLDVLDVAP